MASVRALISHSWLHAPEPRSCSVQLRYDNYLAPINHRAPMHVVSASSISVDVSLLHCIVVQKTRVIPLSITVKNDEHTARYDQASLSKLLACKNLKAVRRVCEEAGLATNRCAPCIAWSRSAVISICRYPRSTTFLSASILSPSISTFWPIAGPAWAVCCCRTDMGFAARAFPYKSSHYLPPSPLPTSLHTRQRRARPTVRSVDSDCNIDRLQRILRL